MQIGRSCYLFRTTSEKFIVDMGLNFDSSSKYPCINLAEVGLLKQVSAVIVTHHHSDHVSALPFLIRAGYSNPIYMTESCLTTSYHGFRDTFKLLKGNREEHIDRDDLIKLYSATYCLKFSLNYRLTDIFFCKVIHSNHIVGGCSLEIKYFGQNFLFTSDFHWRKKESLKPMYINSKTKYDTVILEGTNIDKLLKTNKS